MASSKSNRSLRGGLRTDGLMVRNVVVPLCFACILEVASRNVNDVSYVATVSTE